MLSWFASGFFAKSPVLAAPLIALALFLAVFAVVTIRALFKNRTQIEELAQLPLEDDSNRRPYHG
jgi:mannose/fructose/N-acetylgalactosamine-specific phosphotransferase system component IIC